MKYKFDSKLCLNKALDYARDNGYQIPGARFALPYTVNR